MPRPIYLDYNGTTPHDPEVIKAMRPFLETEFGNPSQRALVRHKTQKGHYGRPGPGGGHTGMHSRGGAFYQRRDRVQQPGPKKLRGQPVRQRESFYHFEHRTSGHSRSLPFYGGSRLRYHRDTGRFAWSGRPGRRGRRRPARHHHDIHYACQQRSGHHPTDQRNRQVSARKRHPHAYGCSPVGGKDPHQRR